MKEYFLCGMDVRVYKKVNKHMGPFLLKLLTSKCPVYFFAGIGLMGDTTNVF